MLRFVYNFYQRVAAKRMFAHWAPIYEDEVTENAYSAADEVAKSVIKHLALHGETDAEMTVADIGIGTGLLAQQIYDSFPCRITGIDFSEDMMAACAGRGITELLIRCDAGSDHWPMTDGAFRVVMSAGLVEYLTPEMLQHFIAESARILQQNGFVVFTYIPDNTDSKIVWWHGHSGSYLSCSYKPEYMEHLITRNGLEIIEHSLPFKGCVFGDGSSYEYRLITARKL